MKTLLRIFVYASLVAASLTSPLIINGCTDTDGKQVSESLNTKVTTSSNGQVITFPKGSPGLEDFIVSSAEKGSATISVIAPARIVTSISHANSAGAGIILFDSPDVTSLYSQYKQSKANVDLTSKNLLRAKQMYENLGVTGKDLNQAETDAATAKASLEEMEGRLKVLGFNPNELESVRGNIVWLMADVPESRLHEINKGGYVRITLAAFPDKTFNGRIEAIGSIVDPNTREIKVRISLTNNDGRFLPGMFAQADFGNKISEAYVLPLSAVVTVEGDNYLFVQTAPNVFERKKVILASSDDSKLVVLSGLSDNEKVVTSGAMLLKGISFGY